MRMILWTSAAALAAAAPAPAFASSDPAAGEAKPRKICRLSSETATRMAVKTCLTADEWRKLARRNSKLNSSAEAENEHMLRSHAEIPDVENGAPGRSAPARDN